MEDKLKACKTKPEDVEKASLELPLADSTTPISWDSAEGTKLAYYLPQALRHIKPEPAFSSTEGDLVEMGRQAIVTLTLGHKPVTEKKDAKRYGKHIVEMDSEEWKAYKAAKAKKWGAWGRYIFGLWHATGQTHLEPGLSADEVKTARRATAVQEWYPAFAPVLQAIGRIFQEVDPWAYHVYRANYQYWAARWEFMKRQYVSSRCCFLSTAILINQHVLPHRDGGDMVNGWVAMTVFGDFEGGYLCLPDLNSRIPFQPGDVVIFRSALLEHYVTRFKGQRYSCVFFTKATVVPKEGLAAFQEDSAAQGGPNPAKKPSQWIPSRKNRPKRKQATQIREKLKRVKLEAERLDRELDELSSD